MNKVGILTYHTGYNYGASLQAYALLTTIKKLGIPCEIINFETEQFVASREMFSHHPRRVKEVIKIVSRIPYKSSLKRRQLLFDDFTRKCLVLSPLYRSEQDVIDHAEEYDCIICGSDQIWNLSQDDAPAANPIFFLNFPKSQKRISYAASFGKWVEEASQHQDIFLPWLKQFDSISVRETSGADYVRSLGLECELTLDPTILLDAEDYDSVCMKRIIHEKYILLFSWLCTDDVVESAKKVAKEMNLPLYNIVPPPRAMGKRITRKLDIGPREFLSMIKYAEFVVTNSFHGTAFSITYKKPFVSVISKKPDLRMESLLEQLELSDHLVEKDNIDVKELLKTDFSITNEKKKKLRQSSMSFLKRALEVER